MKFPAKKTVLFAVKIALAVFLLALVGRQVHWGDYVNESGTSYLVLRTRSAADGADEVLIARGRLWWKTEAWRPVGDFVPTVRLAAGERSREYAQVRRMGVASAMVTLNRPLLALACLGFVASQLIVAVRWWFLLRIQDIRIRLWEAVRLTFLGQFFNTIMPSTVGGDLVKAYYVSRHTHRKAAVLVSIFVDRIMGLTELTALGIVMVILVGALDLARPETIRQPAIALAVVVVILVVAFAFLFSARFRRLFHVQKLYRRLPIAHHFAAAGDAAQLYRRRLGELAKAIAFTFGAHVLWIGSIAMIGSSLHLATPWYSYFLYVPLIYIVGAVPITPGSVGVIEALYAKAFVSARQPSKVIVLALLARIIPVFWALPGAIVAVTGPKLPAADAIQAELGLDDSDPAE